MRILVADDDPLQLEVMQAHLAAWGYDVVTAADGEAAWQRLTAVDGPALAVVDWMMPAPDGPELCRRLRQIDGPTAYVIMVTSKGRRQDVAAGLDAGADDYITKPVDPLELRARLDVGLRLVELRDRLLASERLKVLTGTAGAAAHEIRQPLALIQATVQLCQRDVTDKKQAQRYENLLRAVRQIDGIIERMAKVDHYRTRAYTNDADIVDFDP